MVVSLISFQNWAYHIQAMCVCMYVCVYVCMCVWYVYAKVWGEGTYYKQ